MKFRNFVLTAFLAVLLPVSAHAQVPIKKWERTYGETQGLAFDVVTDSSGNAYVTGWPATVKYDIDGNELWANPFFDGSFPFGTDVGIDPFGNVYVTGLSAKIYCGTSICGFEHGTIKYDPDGNQLWVKRHVFFRGYEHPTLAFDSSGNVYISRWPSISKLDTNGNELWSIDDLYDSYKFSSLHYTAVDSEGNVYVTGRSRPDNQCCPISTVKFDANGNEVWLRKYHRDEPNNSYDRSDDIAVDSSGNVYVLGVSYPFPGPGVGYRIVVIKYDANGNELWVKRYDAFDGYSYYLYIEVDSAGNIYMPGTCWTRYDVYTMYPDLCLRKADTNGNELWFRKHEGDYYDYDVFRDIAFDPSGNVYIVGSRGSGHLAIKYDINGNELWAKYGKGYASALALDSSGNFYVAGGLIEDGSAYRFAVTKYSESAAPSTPEEVVSIIEELLSSGEITDAGIANALIASLTNAQENLETNPTSAKNMLVAVINKLEGQSGKKIDAGAAEELIGYLNNIISAI